MDQKLVNKLGIKCATPLSPAKLCQRTDKHVSKEDEYVSRTYSGKEDGITW